jgi:hypothetical protein
MSDREIDLEALKEALASLEKGVFVDKDAPAIIAALRAVLASQAAESAVKAAEAAWHETDDNRHGRMAAALLATGLHRSAREETMARALEPFARAAEGREGWYDSTELGGSRLTYGDLKRARSALAARGEAEPPKAVGHVGWSGTTDENNRGLAKASEPGPSREGVAMEARKIVEQINDDLLTTREAVDAILALFGRQP